MTRYWVYENWRRKRARMHRADCASCNDGKGKQPEDSGRSGHWLGPFSEREAAVTALGNTGFVDRGICPFCGG
jgi:hypothetical protein